MSERTDILRIFEREPQKMLSTTGLVERIYPQEMRSVQQHLQFGTKEQKRASQLLKSKLHRKTLYYIAKLVSEDVLAVERIDAHGEKIYRVSKPYVEATSGSSTVEIIQKPLKTHYIEEELETKTAYIFEKDSVLSRYNAFYIDCTSLDGLGHATQLLETTLKIVNDVVCLGNFEALIARYKHDELKEFLETLTLLTLDEAKSVCLTIDTRSASAAPFAQLYSHSLPKRVSLVLIVDTKTLASKDVQASIEALSDRHDKVNMHFWPAHQSPLFLGRAGTYGVQEEEWSIYTNALRGKIPGFVVSQASIMLDMQKLYKVPAHDVRKTLFSAAKALYSLASQQRTNNTGVAILSTINPDTRLFFQCTTTYLRLWNHDVENMPMIIESVRDELRTFAATQLAIYRTCGLAFHFGLQLSSGFTHFTEEFSNRDYRKWLVRTSADYDTSEFRAYREQRLATLQLFDNIDRLRVFRAGNPKPEEITKETTRLGHEGFSFITMDFKPLQGVKRLTEFFS